MNQSSLQLLFSILLSDDLSVHHFTMNGRTQIVTKSSTMCSVLNKAEAGVSREFLLHSENVIRKSNRVDISHIHSV